MRPAPGIEIAPPHGPPMGCPPCAVGPPSAIIIPVAIEMWKRERQLEAETLKDIQKADQVLNDARRRCAEAELAARARRLLPPGPYCRKDRFNNNHM